MTYPNFPLDCYASTHGEGWGNHDLTSEEWASAAVNEGFAHAYAAVTFNDPLESDCWFYYYKSFDPNHDGALDSFGPVSCEGGFTTASPNVRTFDAKDFFSDFPCLQPDDALWPAFNAGTEYDWLRFWWDMMSDQNLTVDQVFGIWDLAEPQSWVAAGIEPADPLHPNLPYNRLLNAATQLGLDDEFLAESDNGMHHW